MPEKIKLPFTVTARASGGESLLLIAERDGKQITSGRYRIGTIDKRHGVAVEWANDPRLCDGTPLDNSAVEAALGDAELRALNALEAEGGNAENSGSAASRLVNYVTNYASLFHDESSNGYATVHCGDHKETYPLRSKAFRMWTKHLFYNEESAALSSQAYQDTLGVLEGKALYEGPKRMTHVRVAGHDGRVFFDLCNDRWECVEVTPDGWAIIPIENAPVQFIRKAGMLPLPSPCLGGSIDNLRKLVNITDDDTWRLFVGALIIAFRPKGPYPIVSIDGEQGSGKSTACKMARALIDPNVAPLRRPPRDDRNVMIAAKNSWIVAYDNLSGMKAELSDTLCMLATGGGLGERTLYENDEETLFDSMRPVWCNGIGDVLTRSDALDRAVLIVLPKIDDYVEEAKLWTEFEKQRPSILGALLTGVSAALRNEQAVTLAKRPRMIDFARWLEAAAPALGWKPGEFLDAYVANRGAANQTAVESSAIGPAIIGLMYDRLEWTGIAAELLTELDRHADERTRRRNDWPANPKAMTLALRRLAPNLRAQGIDAFIPDRPTGHRNRREIVLRKSVQTGVASIARVVDPSGAAENGNPCEALQGGCPHASAERVA